MKLKLNCNISEIVILSYQKCLTCDIKSKKKNIESERNEEENGSIKTAISTHCKLGGASITIGNNILLVWIVFND